MSARLLVVDASVVVEVLSSLGRLARAGDPEPAMLGRALDRLVRIPVERYPVAPLVKRAWALRENIALRDGLYVACAEMLTATLLTLDGRLARSAPVPVEPLPSG